MILDLMPGFQLSYWNVFSWETSYQIQSPLFSLQIIPEARQLIQKWAQVSHKHDKSRLEQKNVYLKDIPSNIRRNCKSCQSVTEFKISVIISIVGCNLTDGSVTASWLFGSKTHVVRGFKAFEHKPHTRRKRIIFWGKFNVWIIIVLTFLGLCRKSISLQNALFYLWHIRPRISHL